MRSIFFFFLAIACNAQASEPWPRSTGPLGNYLPLPAQGFTYIDDPSQANRLWESKVNYFGFGKSLSNPYAKFYSFQERYPGAHSGNGGTPVVAEGLLFFNSIRPVGPADDHLITEAGGKTIEAQRKKSIERGMSEEKANEIAKRTKLMWRRQAEDLFFAMDAKTGELRWEVSKPGINIPNGKRDIWKPSPAYWNGKVFALSSTGIVRAFTLKTGKMLWEKDLSFEDVLKLHGHQSFELDLVAVDGRVIIPGPRPLALDAETGEQVWRTPEKLTVQGKFANPALWIHKGRTYLLYTDGNMNRATLRLVEAATGKIVWTYEPKGPMADPPITIGDVAFVTVGGQNATWKKKGKSEEKSGILPIRGGIKLTLEGPEVLWKFPEGDLQYTYVPTPDKGVRRNSSAGQNGVFYYFPNGDPSTLRFMYKIEAKTGKILAKNRQSEETGITKGPYAYEIGDHLLHFPSGAGGDRNFGRTNFRSISDLEKIGDGIPFEKDNPISNYEVFGEHPIANGLIYIRTYKGTIVCYDLRKQ